MPNNKENILKATVSLIVLVMIAAVFLFALNNIVLAQASDADNLLWGGTENVVEETIGLGNTDPRIIISNVINIALGFLGIVAVLLIIYAGFLWMTSNGDESKITQAKKLLTSALIGLVIVLSAFAIAQFILNAFFGATGGRDSATNPNQGFRGGVGVLGDCPLTSVYPEPNQTEVPRNTIIITTFREEIDPTTIEDPGNAGYINPDGRIKIYRSNDDPDVPSNWVTDVLVSWTPDNKTFVFDPVNYLGSPSEYIWYTVALTDQIEKIDGSVALSACNKDWRFHVSNRVDLIPPQVKNGGVFPTPDNAADTVTATTPTQAQGDILVSAQPTPRTLANFLGLTAIGSSPPATISNENYNQTQSGTLVLAIESDGVTARLENIDPPSVLLGTSMVSGSTVTFPGYFTLDIGGASFTVGDSWSISVTAFVQGDTLSAANTVFTFVEVVTGANQIVRGIDRNVTATNIATELNSMSEFSAVVNGTFLNQVDLTAATAGNAGNNILLQTSNPVDIVITPMTGGEGSTETVTVISRRDKARNAVIKIDFNEAINPMTVSGDASDLVNYIAVICEPGTPACDPASDDFFTCNTTEVCLEGRFMISNQYKTVEFLSNNLCGVNGCGEEIYCLPELSNLRVDIRAGSFTDCGADNCSSRSPFTICNGSNCEDGIGVNYPQATTPIDGITDTALNTLDGDRNDEAEGPVSFYNENILAPTPPVAPPPGPGGADNFLWSFYISDRIEITPPEITGTIPASGGTDIGLNNDIFIDFDKIMMSSSLRTGSTVIFNGQNNVVHRLINLRSLSNNAIGYWVTSNDFDTDDPPDGEGNYTRAKVNHSLLPDSVSLRVQTGSGIKDIYQNCFKPSIGPACGGMSPAIPTCCSGTASADSSCP